MISAATGGSPSGIGPAGFGDAAAPPPPKFTTRITGTGRNACAGVYSVTLIAGALAPSPIVPSIRFDTAAPSRARGFVSVTRQVTRGADAGTRPNIWVS